MISIANWLFFCVSCNFFLLHEILHLILQRHNCLFFCVSWIWHIWGFVPDLFYYIWGFAFDLWTMRFFPPSDDIYKLNSYMYICKIVRVEGNIFVHRNVIVITQLDLSPVNVLQTVLSGGSQLFIHKCGFNFIRCCSQGQH